MKNITHSHTRSKRHDDQLIKYIATIKSENANHSPPRVRPACTSEQDTCARETDTR